MLGRKRLLHMQVAGVKGRAAEASTQRGGQLKQDMAFSTLG